jgi:hypothetical protein
VAFKTLYDNNVNDAAGNVYVPKYLVIQPAITNDNYATTVAAANSGHGRQQGSDTGKQ